MEESGYLISTYITRKLKKILKESLYRIFQCVITFNISNQFESDKGRLEHLHFSMYNLSFSETVFESQIELSTFPTVRG